MPPSALRSMSFMQQDQSGAWNGHVKCRDAYEDPLPVGGESMKGAVRPRIAGADMVAVVRKFFSGRQGGGFAHDFVALDHQLRAIRVLDDPLAAEECHGLVGLVADRQEIDESVRLVRRQLETATFIDQ